MDGTWLNSRVRSVDRGGDHKLPRAAGGWVLLIGGKVSEAVLLAGEASAGMCCAV